MRTFLSAVLVFVFSLAASVGLAAHVFAETALNPERAGRLSTWVAQQVGETAESLGTDALAGEALDNLLQAGQLKEQVDRQATANPEVAEALAELVESGKAVEYRQGQETLADALAEAGKPGLAQKVRDAAPHRDASGNDAGNDATFLPDLGTGVKAKIASAHDSVSEFALAAGALAALCALGGLVVANDRRSVARGVGGTVAFTLLFTMVFFLALPWLIEATTESGWMHRFAEGATLTGRDLAAPLVPVFLAGLGLRFAAPYLPQAAGVPSGPVAGWFGKGGVRHRTTRATENQGAGQPSGGFGGREGGHQSAVDPSVVGTAGPDDGAGVSAAPTRRD